MRSAPLLIALAAALLHCASLEPIPNGTCGNGVVDPREDCDSFDSAPGTCGKPTEGAKSCRFTCERLDPARKCPSGWGCGVDGICRAGTGEIETASEPLSGAAFTLIKGDFDGDGRADLIGAPPFGSEGGVRVHYFDADTKLASVTPIDLPLLLPVVFDVDHDGADDIELALAGGGGIAGLKGGRDRTFSALLSPAITFDHALIRAHDASGVLLPNGAACVLGYVEDDDPQHPRRIRSICETDFVGLPFPPYYLPVPEVSPLDLVGGSVARGKVLPSPGTPGTSGCGELVVAVNRGSGADQGHLLIASPCIVTPQGEIEWSSSRLAEGAPVTTVSPLRDVPVPGVIDELPIVADLDSDGVAEVLVHSRGRGYSSFKFALGTFVRSDVRIGEGDAVDERRERILAIGHFDENVVPDAILSSGLVMNDRRLLGDAPASGRENDSPAAPRNQQRWAEAVLGRFNADGRDDLLVRYAGSFDVELFMNGGDGKFTEYVVRSDQPVRAMAHRDLDGDGVEDIAFLEAAAPLAQDSESKLVVAFGKASGAPEQGRTVGTFQRARALLPLRAGDTGVGSLVVVETDALTAPSKTVVTTLYGTSGRQIVSPLFLSDARAQAPLVLNPGEPALRLWTPVALTVGSLLAKGSSDVLAIAVGLTASKERAEALTSVWATSFEGGASFSDLEEVQPLTSVVAGVDPRLFREGTFAISAVAKLADLDLPDSSSPRDGIDEVVAIIRSPEGETGVLVVDQGPNGVGGLPGLLFKLPDTNVSGGDPFELTDLDGDGRRDIVSILTVGGRRALILLRNDGNRKFLPTPVQLELPTDEPPVAFAPLATNAGRALAVVTPQHLFLVKVDAAKSGFEIIKDLTALLGTSRRRLTGVAGGDFDGNGVEDIAVADGGTIRILRQGARNP